jgi:hypothetical protein
LPENEASMEKNPMYAVVRTYSGSGARELFDLLERRKDEVETVIRAVPGLVSYALVRTESGGIAVTVCQDQAGAEESTRLAKEWIHQHASELGSKLPDVDLGSVLVQIT